MNGKSDNDIHGRVIEQFRANAGEVGGGNLLLLHSTRAKSGKPRLNPVAYFRIGDNLLIVGSFRGADVDPAWAHNLRRIPRRTHRNR